MTQLTVVAVLLLGSLSLEVGSKRIHMQDDELQLEESDITQESQLFGTDKICCCEPAGRTQKCYWQEAIPLDTGSGCNWGGKWNPLAKKRHVSGLVDEAFNTYINFDRSLYGSQCVKDRGGCLMTEVAYAKRCVALAGPVVITTVPASRGGDGKPHQWVVNNNAVEEVQAENAVVFEQIAEKGPDKVREQVLPLVTAPEPEAFADPPRTEEIVRAAQVIIEEKVKKLEFLTNKNLKACLRAGNPVLCKDACDLHPPTNRCKRSTAEGNCKKGCHSPLDPEEYNSNARNYCKNVCSIEWVSESRQHMVIPDGTPEAADFDFSNFCK